MGGVAGRGADRALHRSRSPTRSSEAARRRTGASGRYVEAANLAHALGLGINAGHDLDLDNLVLFRTLPHLDEVSIGHALIQPRAYVGLDRAVRDYLRACAAGYDRLFIVSKDSVVMGVAGVFFGVPRRLDYRHSAGSGRPAAPAAAVAGQASGAGATPRPRRRSTNPARPR